MAGTAVSATVTKWTEGISKGVFTASIEWTLVMQSSGTITDFAPTAVAGLFPALPVEGNSYSGFNSSRPLVSCRSVKCEQIEGGVFKYSTDWSDENAKDDEKATDDDPLNDLPIIKPAGGSRERAITRDRADEIILNKAGDPIAQSVDDNTISLNVTKNVAIDSDVEALVLSLRNRVNAAPIQVGNWVIGTNMARVVFGSNFLSEVKRRNDVEYFEFTFDILIDERDKHNGTPLNAGFRQKVWTESDGSTPINPEVDPDPDAGDIYTIQRILSADASEPSEPVPLDDFGRKMKDPQPDTVIYLDVEKYEEGDFTALPGISAWSP
jgi:hypothetical protein